MYTTPTFYMTVVVRFPFLIVQGTGGTGFWMVLVGLRVHVLLLFLPSYPSLPLQLLQKEDAERHDDTATRYPGTLPLTYSGTLPENPQKPSLVLI